MTLLLRSAPCGEAQVPRAFLALEGLPFRTVLRLEFRDSGGD